MKLREEHIGFISVMGVPGVAFAYVAVANGIFNMNFYSTFMPLKLAEFDFQNKDMGFVFAIEFTSYFLVCLIYGFTFIKLPPKIQYCLGLLISLIGNLCATDSTSLGLPQSSVLIIVAMVINCGSSVLLLLANAGEAVALMTNHYNIVDGIDDDLVAKMNDTLASLYGISCNLGGLLARIVGGVLF